MEKSKMSFRITEILYDNADWYGTNTNARYSDADYVVLHII